jgi:hypothetical protein
MPLRALPFWSRPFAAALFAVGAVVLASGALFCLARSASDRRRLATGRAEWIWYTSKLPKPRPLRFFATRDFDLRSAPARALARVFVDRGHSLYVNGEAVGGGTQRPGDALAVYDLLPYLRVGENRVAIEAESPTGLGGVLVALELGGDREPIVSDVSWRVDLEATAIEKGGRYRPFVWGKPPQYPWGYPAMPGADAALR